MTNLPATTKKDLKSIMALTAVRQRFDDMLRGQSASFVTNILNAAVVNPKINECDPISVINAALTAASLGLSINPAVGHAAIVPYKDKAQLIVMVKGIINMAHMTNKYRDINTFKVYEGEGWTEDRITGRLSLTGHRNSYKIIAWGAYFRLANGFEKWLVMSIEEIEAHAKKFSKAWDSDRNQWRAGSGWATNYDAMCRKTPLRLLLMNYGPMTPAMQDFMGEDESSGGEVAGSFVTPELLERASESQEAPKATPGQIMTELGYS
jgi:recombination protein RecT